jgi:hypothetical protein
LSGEFGSLLFEGEDGIPTVLHFHNRPAVGHGFIPSFAERFHVELAVTGPLALGVGVMDEQGETPAVAKAMLETTYITESPFR